MDKPLNSTGLHLDPVGECTHKTISHHRVRYFSYKPFIVSNKKSKKKPQKEFCLTAISVFTEWLATKSSMGKPRPR